MSRVAGVTSPVIASSASLAGISVTRAFLITAPDASSGSSRPGCSPSVVTTSSSGPSWSPLTTRLQPSVVDVVSRIFSAGTLMSAATLARSAVSSDMLSSKAAIEPRPCARPWDWTACMASAVRRDSGPTEPAFRYAKRSRTGNCDRASAWLIGAVPSFESVRGWR